MNDLITLAKALVRKLAGALAGPAAAPAPLRPKLAGRRGYGDDGGNGTG